MLSSEWLFLTTIGANDVNFATKVANFTSANKNASFTGPLAFLNTYQYVLSTSVLTGIGAATEFQAGVSFWNNYGRVLYNATAGQLAFNSTTSPKPTLRTTSQSRIWNSALNWALGFFGTTYMATVNENLSGLTTPYNLVVIAEGEFHRSGHIRVRHLSGRKNVLTRCRRYGERHSSELRLLFE